MRNLMEADSRILTLALKLFSTRVQDLDAVANTTFHDEPMVVAYYYRRGRPSVDVERPLPQLVTEPLQTPADNGSEATQQRLDKVGMASRRVRQNSFAEQASLLA